MAEPKIGVNRGNAGKGRPKGSTNKATAIIKDAITSVYADLQESVEGAENANAHFLAWAQANATEFYKLAAKLIPVQVTGEDGEALQIVVNKPGG